jgi:hypothetical protein
MALGLLPVPFLAENLYMLLFFMKILISNIF